MTDSKDQAQSLFLNALEIRTAGERAAYVEAHCGADPELRKEVEELLDHARRLGPFLEPGEEWIDGTIAQPISERAGAIIGPYKLLQQIGEGGMGVVFMAEQTEPLQRTVALKIIKPGMDTRQVIARFEAERQAVAMMDHPNIAKVLDAGTTDSGRPYFVMELVKGVPIIDYCDLQQLSIRERLELLIAVCQAVQHAHQKGIIHRDLKPSNVLVAEYDGRPVPKIIDFGVAKAVGQRLIEQTMFTNFGQIIGTFEYMSPEQARFNQLDVDTRSDIYSVGVLLYELLAGSTPFEKQRRETAALDEILRIIAEEESPPPSTRLSSSGGLPAIATRRRTEPARLNRLVRGELDWIVMKAIDKDRGRRYQTAAALALDLQRYLHDEPVEACPPSPAYRLEKLARRHRAALMAAGLVAAALVMGSVASVSQAVRATKAETLAEARLEAEARAHREANEARAKAEANSQRARLAVDNMYTQVAEKWLAHQPQMEPIQREFLEKALGFYTEFAKETSNDLSIRFETARAYRRVAEIQHRLGKPAQAEDAFRQAIEHTQSLVDEFPTKSAYRAELAATLHKLGVLLGDTGRYLDEEKIHRRALALEEKLIADSPSMSSYRRDFGRGHWFVAEVLASLHRRHDAEQAYQSALAIQRPLVAEFPAVAEYRQHVAESYLGLGQALRLMRRFDEHRQALAEAAAILEQLAVEFPSLPNYRNQLADVYYWQATPPAPPHQAEHYLRAALTIQRKLADDFPAVADYRYDLSRSQKTLGLLLIRNNRPEEAEAALREAAAIAEKLVADSPSVHYYRGRLALIDGALGRVLTETGRHREAEDAYRRSIAIMETLVAEFPDALQYGPDLRNTYRRLGSLLKAAGQPEQAADAYRKAQHHHQQASAALAGNEAEKYSEIEDLEGDDTDHETRPPSPHPIESETNTAEH